MDGGGRGTGGLGKAGVITRERTTRSSEKQRREKTGLGGLKDSEDSVFVGFVVDGWRRSTLRVRRKKWEMGGSRGEKVKKSFNYWLV